MLSLIHISYLIINGDDAGLFTKTSGGDAVEIPCRFIGEKGTGDVAPVELFYQAAVTAGA